MIRVKILDYLTQNKDFYKGKYCIIKIGLLGSYARGEEKSRSDIDIIIEIEKSKKKLFMSERINHLRLSACVCG